MTAEALLVFEPFTEERATIMRREWACLAYLNYRKVVLDSELTYDDETYFFYNSLRRFGLVEIGHASGIMNGTAWRLTEQGESLLRDNRARLYGCRCEYAIRLPCTCEEATYCPNPAHTRADNGCHGPHG